MSDPTDLATDREDKERERAIAAARGRSNLPPPEECDNGCGEPPRAGSRYCCRECLEDHESRRRIEKRLGVR